MYVQGDDVTESCVSASRIDIKAMLQENTAMQSITIQSRDRQNRNHFVLVTALQHNKTLKSLEFLRHLVRCNDDEDKQIDAILMTKFALPSCY
jgi:hypothetical protein